MDFAIAPFDPAAALQERLHHSVGYKQPATSEGDPELLRLLREKLERGGERPHQPPATQLEPASSPASSPASAPPILLNLTNPAILSSPSPAPVPRSSPACPPGARPQNSAGPHDPAHRPHRSLANQLGFPRTRYDPRHQQHAPPNSSSLCHPWQPHRPPLHARRTRQASPTSCQPPQSPRRRSDSELHSDLTLEGTHIPFATIADESLRQRTITLTGPCKNLQHRRPRHRRYDAPTTPPSSSTSSGKPAPLGRSATPAAIRLSPCGKPPSPTTASWRAPPSSAYLRDSRNWRRKNSSAPNSPASTVAHIEGDLPRQLPSTARASPPHAADASSTTC